MNIAILGTGKIGCDLLVKVINSESLNCVLFCGRRPDSPGIAFARKHNIQTSINGAKSILARSSNIDLVFDATSASAHYSHGPLLESKNIQIINLTPAPTGALCVPTIDLSKQFSESNISLITCGGQASIPIIHAVSKVMPKIDYVEVITTIAAKSAGGATRRNISEYQQITEAGITAYSGCQQVKSILVINPAEPAIVMQSAIYMLGSDFDLNAIRNAITKVVNKIKNYIPGYQILTEPVIDDGRLVIIIKVIGKGDYLPTYAGNLDIITSSAIKVAESIAQTHVFEYAMMA